MKFSLICLFYSSVTPATMNQLETRGMTRASGLLENCSTRTAMQHQWFIADFERWVSMLQYTARHWLRRY